MKTKILFFLILFTSFGVFAQKPTSKPLSEQEKQLLQDAEYFYLSDDYAQALPLFLKALKLDNNNYNLNFKIGMCYLRMPFEAGRSIPFFEKGATGITKQYVEGSVSHKFAPIEVLYNLGYAYHTNKYYDKAYLAYQRYLDTLSPSMYLEASIAQRQLQSCRNAKNLMKTPVPVEVYNLGNVINSSYNDYNPCATSDGKLLFYTRVEDTHYRNKKGTIMIGASKNQKVMMSTYLGNDRWSDPICINEELQTAGELNTVSVNADGTFLILYKNTWEEGGMLDITAGTLYYSTRIDNKSPWMPIKKFNKNINTPYNQTHASISPDGRQLYVASTKPGGFGGLDIYVSNLEKGGWGPLQNLGSNVNTLYDEQTPVMLADGSTLVLSSEGHFNIGGFDIFKTTRIDGVWSEPINMGVPINTPDDNLYYYPIGEGKEVFYALARHEGYLTFGGIDIYKMEIYDKEEDKKTILATLQGVISFKDNRVIDTTTMVTISNIDSAMVYKVVRPNADGDYSIPLPEGRYSVVFSRKNYKSVEKNIIVEKVTSDKTIAVHALLLPDEMANKKVFSVQSVYYDLNSIELNNDAIKELSRIVAILKKNPNMFIEVLGAYTDSYGKLTNNRRLANTRSRKVINYITSQGVPVDRFINTGGGNTSRATADETVMTEIEKAKFNRSVEIRLFKVENSVLEAESASVNMRYSVLAKVSQTPIPFAEFNKIHDKIKIMEIKYLNEYYYYYGDFKTKAEAAISLNKCIEKGYVDSKIIDYYALNSMNEFAITKPIKYAKSYTIQLQALEKPIILHPNPIMSLTKRYRTKDGYYRYTYMEFASMAEAEVELQKIIEAGFPNAMIVEVNNLDK